MLLKKGHDALVQMIQPSNTERHSLLAVRANHAAPEEFLQCEKELIVASVLDNGEFRKHLKPSGHLRMGIYADVETTFAVNKSDHPLGF